MDQLQIKKTQIQDIINAGDISGISNMLKIESKEAEILLNSINGVEDLISYARMSYKRNGHTESQLLKLGISENIVIKLADWYSNEIEPIARNNGNGVYTPSGHESMQEYIHSLNNCHFC